MIMVQVLNRDKPDIPKASPSGKSCEIFANGALFNFSNGKKKFVPFEMMTIIEFDNNDSTVRTQTVTGQEMGWAKSNEESYLALVKAFDAYLSEQRQTQQFKALKAE